MGLSTPGHRIPRHCTFIDIYCYLSPYDSAEPFSHPRAKDNGEARSYTCAYRDRFPRRRFWCAGTLIVLVSQKQR